jgi:subtilisin family serine protease
MDEYGLLEQLNSSYSKLFSNIELRPKPKLLYNPSDWMWSAYIAGENDWLWYLDKIQADQAWNITKGNPNVKIAVIDNGVDPNHPDIIGKINPSYDFYTGGAFTVEDHGTSVVSLLAGETVEQGQTPNGIQASIGFNSKVMFASWGGGTAACLYASTVLHAKIISISWYYSCSPNVTDLLIEQEILNNGTSIIKAAGNGPSYCGGGLLYPFSGLEDDRTIIVSSTDKNDNHEDLNPGTVATVSHYPQVDICAPGYELMAATPGSSWLYTTWGGTSQSTPIVAGVAALMLSVNQCMESTDIQTIIKQTADPITDALNYPGTVGAGRINAYKAVS